MIRLVSMLLLFFSFASAQVWQGYTINPPYRLNAVSYYGTKGYAVGEGGVIALTTTMGRSWSILRTGAPTEWLNSVFANGPDVYAVGDNGLMLKSTNAGTTWEYVVLNSTEKFRKVYFQDVSIGYILGDNSTMFRTTNSGLTWSKVNFNLSANLLTMQYASPLVGIIGAGANGAISQVLVTENGGAGYLPLSVPYVGAIFCVAAPSNDVFFAAGEFGVLKSSNRGLTWQNITLNLPGYTYAGDIKFTDTQNGIIITNAGVIYRTANGGASFSIENAFTVTTGMALAMYTPDLEQINLVGYGEKQSWVRNPPIEISLDSTAAYVRDTAKVAIRLRFPVTQNTYSFQMYLSGYSERLQFLAVKHGSGSLLQSSDWAFVTNNANSRLRFISYGTNPINSSGVLGYLYFKTPDTLTTTLDSLFITIDSAYFNTGDYPVVLKNGKVVLKKTTPGDVDQNGRIQAYDASLVLRHLVGGVTLNEDQLRNAEVTNDHTVSSLDASVIAQYVAGLIPSLPWTGNFAATGSPAMQNVNIRAGEVFTVPVYLPGSGNIFAYEGTLQYDAVLFEFQGLEFAPGFRGSLKDHIQAGGSVKFALSALESRALPGAEALVKLRLRLKDNTIFTGGSSVVLTRLRINENEELLNATSGQVFLVTGLSQPGALPSAFSLGQNFPNPFNPSTVIPFELPVNSKVLLSVYNQLGEVVAVLADGEYPAGSHTVSFYAANLRSGVYFYTITAAGFTNTKKLLLVK